MLWEAISSKSQKQSGDTTENPRQALKLDEECEGITGKAAVAGSGGVIHANQIARLAIGSAMAWLAMSLLGLRAQRAWAEENPLEKLARSHFPAMQLTACESNQLRNVAIGKVAYCGPSHSEKDPAPADTGVGRMPFDVDAELIRWLCPDPAAVKLIDPAGIQVEGARVVHQLDLSYATVTFPLSFENSRFTEDISLAYGQFLYLDLLVS